METIRWGGQTWNRRDGIGFFGMCDGCGNSDGVLLVHLTVWDCVEIPDKADWCADCVQSAKADEVA